MTIVDSPLSTIGGSEPRTMYVIDCHRCSRRFDSAHADWCSCLAKERTFVCPHCLECFCRAELEFKLRFWTSAPAMLWERKLKLGKQPAIIDENLAPDEVRRPLVLIVDDDRDICSIATRVIEGTQFGSIIATDGEEAVRLAQLYKPDVVLTDALMPKMDGREVCRLIKSNADLTETKVIIMSSVYTSSRFRREALTQFKADDFLVKPVSPSALRDVLSRAVGDHVPVETIVAPLLSITSDEVLEASVPDVVVPVSEPLPVDEELSISLEEEESPAPPLPPETRVTIDSLVRLARAGVDAPFIRELRACDRPFSIDEMIELKASGSDVDEIRRLHRAGFSAGEIVRLGASGVTAALVEELRILGYHSLTPQELIRLGACGVDPAFIRELHLIGCGPLTAGELITLAAIGVGAEMLRAMKTLGVDVSSPADLIRLRANGVDESLLREMTR